MCMNKKEIINFIKTNIDEVFSNSITIRSNQTIVFAFEAVLKDNVKTLTYTGLKKRDLK